MPKKVPTLSSSGWVDEIRETTDKLLSYFFVSDQSQSHLYRNMVYSLPYLIRNNNNNQVELRSSIEDQLTTFLGRYFDNVNITATISENEEDDRGLEIAVDILVIDGGRQYSAGRLVSTLNSSIMKIADINNQGRV